MPPSSTMTPPAREDLLADLDDSLFRLSWHFRHMAERVFAPLGLNPVRAVVLALIAREDLHPKDLAERLVTAPPAVSQLLRDLEGRGLVTRSPADRDRRRIDLHLTGAGRATLAQLRRRWHTASRDRLSALDDADLATLLRIHETLLETP